MKQGRDDAVLRCYAKFRQTLSVISHLTRHLMKKQGVFAEDRGFIT
jgi:hypothetical protein